MRITTHVAGFVAKVALHGRFEFSANHEFKSCTRLVLQTKEVREIEIDMSDVNYIDSSALGMLLVLREEADKALKKISLLNCRGVIKQVLDMANFSKLFIIK